MIQQIIKEEITRILRGESDKPVVADNTGRLMIVILNRGWVAMGRFTRDGDMCKLTNASIIRKWGTDKGIGQLAIEGKQSETKLDKITDFEFHILTTVGMFECDEKKWK